MTPISLTRTTCFLTFAVLQKFKKPALSSLLRAFGGAKLCFAFFRLTLSRKGRGVNRAIFLDRDGVLNKAIIKNGKPYPPSSIEELHIPEEVLPALQLLKSAGFLLIGATNQPDVARGTTPISVVKSINSILMDKLPLDEIRVCYHDDKDNCACRKPAPGLLLDAAKNYSIDLSQSFMIGDRWKDIEAGQRAGCKTIWIQQGYLERKPNIPANYETSSLLDAAKWILTNQQSS
jgi:D-glycero-D-manno-heptose 1,7-bisphosphate phosphatase